MSITIGSGIAAVSSGVGLNKSIRELSSGKKLNSAADNVADLGISQRMEAQEKEFATKMRGLQNDISFYQVGDSSLEGIATGLNRLRELAVQSKNSTLTSSDRSSIQNEAEMILDQIDKAASYTEFNTLKVISNVGTSDLGIDGLDLSSADVFDKIDEAQKIVTENRSEFGSKMNATESEIRRVGVARENTVAANSRISDTDIALSMIQNTSERIKDQVRTALTAQSNLDQGRILDILK